eukprot:Rhum_TRINITY_DN3622_c0_g1::Rhum_TRINITY_DN3622_c0_g1_i1::g.11389::m.11389
MRVGASGAKQHVCRVTQVGRRRRRRGLLSRRILRREPTGHSRRRPSGTAGQAASAELPRRRVHGQARLRQAARRHVHRARPVRPVGRRATGDHRGASHRQRRARERGRARGGARSRRGLRERLRGFAFVVAAQRPFACAAAAVVGLVGGSHLTHLSEPVLAGFALKEHPAGPRPAHLWPSPLQQAVLRLLRHRSPFRTLSTGVRASLNDSDPAAVAHPDTGAGCRRAAWDDRVAVGRAGVVLGPDQRQQADCDADLNAGGVAGDPAAGSHLVLLFPCAQRLRLCVSVANPLARCAHSVTGSEDTIPGTTIRAIVHRGRNGLVSLLCGMRLILGTRSFSKWGPPPPLRFCLRIRLFPYFDNSPYF